MELKTNQDRALMTMQKIELEGLKEIDRICRKHGINYSLGGGTCLGQVRHGGFIPWDDDIDVDMTVENYDRFMEVVFDELDSSRFFLRCRKTDPTHFRTSCRLEIKGTHLSIPRWDKSNKETAVFVDIFRWNYLPDDEALRKKVASKLFYIRCLQSYKEYHKFASKLPPNKHFGLRLRANLIPKHILEKQEERLVNCCNGKKTNWIMDDSIIHGDYGGYPADGVDEYEDVMFEGICVRNKKNPHNFLRTIYGEHYMDWLPPAGRISHHAWTVIDFGKYESLYQVDPSYKDSLTVNYSKEKLTQMKIVAEEMVHEISALCNENHLRFAIAGVAEDAYEESFEGVQDLWDGPPIIMMPRTDFDTFARLFKNKPQDKYFYQSHVTEPDFPFFHARIRLNLTKLREKRVKPRLEKKYHSGFYIKIVPLDSLPKNRHEKKLHLFKVKKYNNILLIKRRCDNLESFRKLPLMQKLNFLIFSPWKSESIYQKLDQLVRKYSEEDSSQMFDSANQLGLKVMEASALSVGATLPIRHKGAFVKEDLDAFIKKISKQYGPCYLTYYDIPDRQLSIIRYDEKADRYLTTPEILAQQEKVTL